jgi:type VI secretion system secreted protein Hcp
MPVAITGGERDLSRLHRDGEAHPAPDRFLKLDGIAGEAKDVKHEGEIRIESFDFRAVQKSSMSEGGTGGGGIGKVQMQDVLIRMKASKAGPKLLLNCITGKHIKSAVLTERKAGGQQEDYNKVTLTDVIVTRYTVVGGDSPQFEEPVEEVALNFAEIEMEYKEQKDDGTLGAGNRCKFNLKTMQAG